MSTPPTPDRTDEADVPHLVVCSGCGAAAPTGRATPPGWVVARPTEARRGTHVYGVCPTCLAERYTFPSADPIARTTPLQIGP